MKEAASVFKRAQRQAGGRMLPLASVANLLYLAASIVLLVLTLQSHAARGSRVVSPRSAALALAVLLFLGVVLRGSRAVNIVVCLLATGLIAFGQAWLHPRRVAEYPAGATRQPRPYMMFTGLPGEEDHNELGYRGRVPPQPKTGEYRVLVIGGSAVYGKGEPYLTIPSQLQRMARRHVSSDISVYNWGVVSQVSGQEVATITHRASRYAPDLVVLYDGGNDVYHAFIADPRPGYPFNFSVSEHAVGIFQAGDLRALGAGLLTQSNLLRALFPLELSDAAADIAPLRRAVGFGTPAWEESVVQAYLDNLDCACRLGAGLDFRLAVFLQPVVYFTPRADTYRGMGSDFHAYVERQYDRIRKGLDVLAARHAGGRCSFIDLSRVCAQGECVFSDFIHPTPGTRAPIAEAILGHLRERSLLTPASR